MFNPCRYKSDREKCCKYMKNFIAFLKLLTNLAGFICLCILVNWSSGVDYKNLDIINKLSKATLSIKCGYIFFAIICFMVKDKKHPIVYALMIFTLLLWIARYALFVILMYYVEGCDLEKYNKIRKRGKIRKLKNIFHSFAVIEIIVGAIEQIDSLIPELDKNDYPNYNY